MPGKKADKSQISQPKKTVEQMCEEYKQFWLEEIARQRAGFSDSAGFGAWQECTRLRKLQKLAARLAPIVDLWTHEMSGLEHSLEHWQLEHRTRKTDILGVWTLKPN